MQFKSVLDTQQLAEILGNRITVNGFQKAVDLPRFSVAVLGNQKKSLISKAALLVYDFKQHAISSNELPPAAFDRLLRQRVNLETLADDSNKKADEFVRGVGVDPVVEARPVAALKLVIRATHLLPYLLPGLKERLYAQNVDWRAYHFEVLDFVEDLESDLDLIGSTLGVKSKMSALGLEGILAEIRRKCATELEELHHQQDTCSVRNVSNMVQKVHPMCLQFLIRDVLAAMGHVNIQPRDGAGDNGIDLVSYKIDDSGTRRRYIVQCKARASKMGKSDVHQFALQCAENDARGIYVSLGGFTKSAADGQYQISIDGQRSTRIQKIADVTLVDRGLLVQWVTERNIGATRSNAIDYQYWARLQTPLLGHRFA
ncbi:restriction endonuclease [Alicyclobacillus herbarius]|uniref:restriction endonuclease n=1 Tax=Alicyclobacillus herbarius TaxID=122960 RepID=UPI00047ECFD0|nr:restriction endonuclease [Alicyclobacillus herbarius]